MKKTQATRSNSVRLVGLGRLEVDKDPLCNNGVIALRSVLILVCLVRSSWVRSQLFIYTTVSYYSAKLSNNTNTQCCISFQQKKLTILCINYRSVIILPLTYCSLFLSFSISLCWRRILFACELFPYIIRKQSKTYNMYYRYWLLASKHSCMTFVAKSRFKFRRKKKERQRIS